MAGGAGSGEGRRATAKQYISTNLHFAHFHSFITFSLHFALLSLKKIPLSNEKFLSQMIVVVVERIWTGQKIREVEDGRQAVYYP